ncbi:hypothetical protein ACG9XS_08770 [Acinetobacter gyllenbergii]|uniref:hypothetical protein n=1 Tax=Acinetobacter gyllenbergii TaxID=134534 RepID=UPI003AF85CDC
MKKILLISLVVGLTGCVSPQYNYVPKAKDVSKPAIGSINTAFVGDALLSQGRIVERNTLVVDETFKPTFQYEVKSGSYPQTGEDDKNKYFAIMDSKTKTNGVQSKMLSDPPKDLMVDSKGELCIISVYNTKYCGEAKNTRIETENVITEKSFQQTLIYSGKVGNKINIGYREFSNDVARPAFNNNVEYDLNESKEIGYKGALLEIIEATNQNIKYKVIKNFNKVD